MNESRVTLTFGKARVRSHTKTSKLGKQVSVRAYRKLP